ncbi:MAG: RNA polymerase sigma factor region1.1 domain-containing protein, partial [Opitutales bacterium]
MPEKKNKKTTDKPAKASKQAKPVVKAPAKAPAKPAVKAVAAKAPAAKAAAKPAAPQGPAKPVPPKAAVAVKTLAKVTPAKPPAPAVGPAINEKVQLLVSLSKKNGFVTVQNINEVIPDSATDPELIENIMNILDNLDIKLLDEDEVETYRKKVEDSEEEAARTVPADAPYDPFNVYLKQMGHKP